MNVVTYKSDLAEQLEGLSESDMQFRRTMKQYGENEINASKQLSSIVANDLVEESTPDDVRDKSGLEEMKRQFN